MNDPQITNMTNTLPDDPAAKAADKFGIANEDLKAPPAFPTPSRTAAYRICRDYFGGHHHEDGMETAIRECYAPLVEERDRLRRIIEDDAFRAANAVADRSILVAERDRLRAELAEARKAKCNHTSEPLTDAEYNQLCKYSAGPMVKAYVKEIVSRRIAPTCRTCRGEGLMDVIVSVEPPDGREKTETVPCGECGGTGYPPCDHVTPDASPEEVKRLERIRHRACGEAPRPYDYDAGIRAVLAAVKVPGRAMSEREEEHLDGLLTQVRNFVSETLGDTVKPNRTLLTGKEVTP